MSLSIEEIRPRGQENSTAATWRYRCPEGHTSWKPRTEKGGVYCGTCLAGYQTLVDVKTGEEVTP